MTPGAEQAMLDGGHSHGEFLERHARGDWGDLSEEDKQENELAVEQGFRILSAYHTSKGCKLWVITESDRSVTTILLPDEY